MLVNPAASPKSMPACKMWNTLGGHQAVYLGLQRRERPAPDAGSDAGKRTGPVPVQSPELYIPGTGRRKRGVCPE